MVVSKRAFEKEMAAKDDQIKVLMNSVNNLQAQVQLLQRQLDLKEKIPGRSSSRDSLEKGSKASSTGYRNHSTDQETNQKLKLMVRKGKKK